MRLAGKGCGCDRQQQRVLGRNIALAYAKEGADVPG